MSELSPWFEPPEDRPKPTEPEHEPAPERDLDDLLADRALGVIDRAAETTEPDERPEPRASDRPALEAVCNEVGHTLHDRMPLDRWEAADLRERLEFARETHELIRDRHGLDATDLHVSSQLGDRILGSFDPDSGRVTVNDRLLTEATPRELIDTLAHENQHAMQQEISDGNLEHPLGDLGRPEIDAWRRGGQSYDPADIVGLGYGYNPLEVDANNAGRQTTDGFDRAYDEAREEDRAALKARVEALEAQVESQQALIERQAALIESLSANRDPDQRPGR